MIVVMKVDENTEHYLIHSMGLNKKQIKDMLPSEIDEHCDKIIKERIKERGIYIPELQKKKKSTKKTAVKIKR
jgi:hypothetical protein